MNAGLFDVMRIVPPLAAFLLRFAPVMAAYRIPADPFWQFLTVFCVEQD